jgi:uncharacterized membrane protein YozB (DUF420 family)
MSSLPLSALPALNAALNATCAVLLVSGYLMIRRRKVLAHKICTRIFDVKAERTGP